MPSARRQRQTAEHSGIDDGSDKRAEAREERCHDPADEAVSGEPDRSGERKKKPDHKQGAGRGEKKTMDVFHGVPTWKHASAGHTP